LSTELHGITSQKTVRSIRDDIHYHVYLSFEVYPGKEKYIIMSYNSYIASSKVISSDLVLPLSICGILEFP